MSEENVEIVRRAYEEFAAHGVPPWEFFTADAEFDATEVMPDARVTTMGDIEIAERDLRTYTETFEDFHIELEEVVHADEHHVVTAVRDGGRIKGSDAEIWNRFFHVFTIDGGKIARWSSHLDKDRALEAAGLSE